MKAIIRRSQGFTLIEMMIGIMMLGVILIAFGGIFALFQKSATQSRQFTDSQQNSRFAIDYLTENLRQAGAGTDYVNGQLFIVEAAPYQVAINADIDRGETLSGDAPLTALIGPTTVPSAGTFYSPTETFDSDAETVVLTLDSSEDGVINSSDQGDDAEESGSNPNLYVLVKRSYGAAASANDTRSTHLAMLRGPGAYPDASYPPPLFQYLYDHDLDFGTADRLWGDTDLSGSLSDSEIATLGAMPDSLHGRIRKIQITATSEADQYNPKFESTGGYLSVEMRSEVTVRNATRRGSTIIGRVFQDVNGDGVRDADENGIPSVSVEIVGGSTVLTNGYGVYKFVVNSGTFTVRETDPSGFISTTPNDVTVTVADGQSKVVDYGDQNTIPVGYIKGTVFDDLDQDGYLTTGEPGIEGVVIDLNTGEQMITSEFGDYSFTVALGSYDVTETDPEGMGSTTPNTVNAVVAAAGDSAIVDFGDTSNPIQGVIEGYVFEDENQDGIRDLGEGGIPGVTITVASGSMVDSISTDQTGFYSFSLDSDSYDVSEADPSGYVSTTLNMIPNVLIVPDTVVTIDFGDIIDHTVSFGEAAVANIDGAMAMSLGDFGEDGNSDTDIIIGSPTTGGAGNVLVFLNQWVSASTPSSQIFAATPSYYRDAGQTVATVRTVDYTRDGKPDVITGLDYSNGVNIQTWSNDGTGIMSMSPDTSYLSVFPTLIQTSELADVDGDGATDVILGLKSPLGTFTGGFQVFKASGGGFVASQSITTAAAVGDIQLGEIWAIESADFDRDGDLDLVVGSHTSDFSGAIDFYENLLGAGVYRWYSRYSGGGAVNDIEVVDMLEDGDGDLDVIVAVSTADNAGRVYVWEHGQSIFGVNAVTGSFPYPTTPAWPNDAWDLGGEVLTLKTSHINLDIFPDVFVGTGSRFYQGDTRLVISSDYKNALPLNSGTMGSVGTLELGDFNKDGRIDAVAATRTSSSLGRLVVFYNTSN